MTETKEISRRYSYVRSGDKRRSAHKFFFNDDEYEDILRFTKENGYNKPRDMIVHIARYGSPERALLENQKQCFAIQLNALGTHINKIRSGIDVDNACNALMEGVEKLCHIYKL